ncbi:hypothetical protein KCV00_g154, partial [Aureobasidium melanogenum]
MAGGQQPYRHDQDKSRTNNAKPLIYLGLGLAALVYLIQRGLSGSNTKSRLHTRSPDPEKPTGTRTKAPERPDGGGYRLLSHLDRISWYSQCGILRTSRGQPPHRIPIGLSEEPSLCLIDPSVMDPSSTLTRSAALKNESFWKSFAATYLSVTQVCFARLNMEWSICLPMRLLILGRIS